MPVVYTVPEQPVAPAETLVELVPAPVQVEPVQPTPLVVPEFPEPSPATLAQPTATPVAPASFGTPQPTVTAPAAKKSKKGLIIGLSIAGGVILAAIIAVVLWFTLAYVSKTDYQKVSDAYAKSSKDLSDVKSTTDLLGSVATADLSSVADTNKTKAETYASDVSTMGSLKAVKLDKDINKAYVSYSAKATDYKNTVVALSAFMLVESDCTQVTTKTELSSCIVKLRNLKNEGSSIVANIVTATADYFDTIVRGTPDSATYTAALSKLKDDSTTLKDDLASAGDSLKSAIDSKIK